MLAGVCADPGVLGAAVGSCLPLAALVTVVAMSAAAAGRSGSGMLGMRGRPADFESWCCSVGWLPCAAFPAGVPDEESLDDLVELVLGEVGVPEGPLPEMRFDKVGFTLCGLAVELGALGELDDSVPDGVLAARGIGGSS